MLITWPIELFNFEWYYSLASKNITVFIKLFTTVVIFVAFAGKKAIEIVKSYDTLENSLL